MKKSVPATLERAVRRLKAMLIPGLALLLALVPAAVVNSAVSMPVSAAIEPRGIATTGITYNTDLTIDKPTGVVAGDVMIVNIAKVGNGTMAPSAAGWTLMAGMNLGFLRARHGAVLYRVANGTEGASFTFALGAGTDSAVGSIVAFSGVDTSGATPFDVAPGTVSVQDTQSVVATSTTTVSADAAVIMFGMAAGSAPDWSDWATTSPGALAELYDSQVGGPGGASVGAAWAIKDIAGATGAGAAMLSFAVPNGGILIALKPAKPTTLSVAPAIGTYSDTASLTATLSPAVSGKTISFTLNGVDAGTAVTDGSGVANIPAASLAGIDHGTYPAGVGAGFAGGTDYSASVGTASLTVEPREIEVTADDSGKIYGGADTLLTYQISSGSLAAGDAFSGKLNRTAGESVGTYTIQQGTLDLSGNYNLTFVEGAFNISLRPLVITASSLAKILGDTTSFTGTEFTTKGLVGGDSVTSVTLDSTGAAANAAEGSYPIVVSNAAGTGLANYAIAYEVGTLRVFPADVSPPEVTSVRPNQGVLGQNLRVVIAGTDFIGVMSLSFGDGITIDGYTVSSDTQITADITILEGAAVGSRAISVNAIGGSSTLSDALTVVAPNPNVEILTPTVDSVSPDSGRPGDTFNVVIRGSNFAAVTAVDLGPGVTVNNFVIDSPTQIRANISIDSAAKPGSNDIVVAAPSGDGSLTGSFAVGISKNSSEALVSQWFWWLMALLVVLLALLLFVLDRRSKKTLALQPLPTLTTSSSLERTKNPVEHEEVSISIPSESLGHPQGAVDSQQPPISTPFKPTESSTEDLLRAGTPTTQRSPARKTRKTPTSTPSQSVRRKTTKVAKSTPEEPRRRKTGKKKKASS